MKYSRAVKIWLLVGLAMVFVQVIVGGITRLTESGLSITKWEVIEGSIPPLSEEEWNKEFELYKNTPQYEEVFEGISMKDFKFIYFWEFIHRFWARLMGFVFLIPFLYFLWKKKIDGALIKKLSWVILFAMLAAIFGWIMVASGLKDRPWVNAYKLSIHLSIAFAVFVSLYYCYKYVVFRSESIKELPLLSKGNKYLLGLLLGIQVVLGGIMSGMKAGVYFPTWPKIGDEYIPHVVFNIKNWNVSNFADYDTNIFVPSLFHLLHRSTAYLLFIVSFYLLFKIIKSSKYTLDRSYFVFFGMLISQILIGIITVLMCKGEVPIFYGVLHQGVALLLVMTFLNVIISKRTFV